MSGAFKVKINTIIEMTATKKNMQQQAQHVLLLRDILLNYFQTRNGAAQARYLKAEKKASVVILLPLLCPPLFQLRSLDDIEWKGLDDGHQSMGGD
jgi:hypothetical protein